MSDNSSLLKHNAYMSENCISKNRSKIGYFFEPVTHLTNVGDKTSKFLAKLGIYRIIDLLFHQPSHVIDVEVNPSLSAVIPKALVRLEVTVLNIDPKPSKKFTRNKPFKIYCAYHNHNIQLVYFNYYPEYLIRNLKINSKYFVQGNIDKFAGAYQIAHPDYLLPASSDHKIPNKEIVYPVTLGLTSKQIRKYILQVLEKIETTEEWIDDNIVKTKGWYNFKESLCIIHNVDQSKNTSQYNQARERLCYDEFLAHQLAINLVRQQQMQNQGRQFFFTGKLAREVISNIGFTLTAGQEKAMNEIIQDQQSTHRMTRLIQGDVGSGKTLVALASILNVIEAGPYQTCLMAPTDILANQHYQWISKILTPYNIKVELLTGKITSKKKREIIDSLRSGEIQILIGTHAVFQTDVEFRDLALVIIDEQHRFGVEQRAAIYSKGNNADFILMTATPIPRTLTLALYGDLEISRITDKPAGRIPINTTIMSISKIDELIGSLSKKIKEGSLVYWICPLVENKEDSESNDESYAAAINRHKIFSETFDCQVGLVHGKMKTAEKDINIQKFAQGEYKILVATTVIEVGIDVPDANIIVVEQAEKFGLSQLHQLRGRVGRGKEASYCILLFSKHISENAYKRLNVLKMTNDGFILSEKDLEFRGSGNIAGTKQSGLPDFKFSDFTLDLDLLEIANNQAKKIVSNNSNLNQKQIDNLKYLLKIFKYDTLIINK